MLANVFVVVHLHPAAAHRPSEVKWEREVGSGVGFREHELGRDRDGGRTDDDR